MSHTLEQFRGSVSVTDFGAVGDGVTDDTTAIQNALNTALTVHFPAPTATYKVSGPLSLRTGHTLIGPGQYVDCLAGDGTDTLIETGVVGGANIRMITIVGMKATNSNHPCLELYNSQEFTIRDCFFSGSSATTVDVVFSYRGVIQNSRITASGAGVWAISCMNNCNGVILDGNTVTGGSGGNAIDVGQSQAVRISGNIIEANTVGYGIRVGGNAVGGGICSGVVVLGNYLEEVGKPISIAEQYLCYGVTVESNRITQGNSDADDCPYGMIFGRMQCSSVSANYYFGCITHKVTVDTVDDTATYTVTLNGTAFNYPAVGGDLEADILAGLQAVIDASGSYTATVVSGAVEIELDDSPVQDFSSSVSATGTGALSLAAPVVFYFDNDSNNGLDFVYNNIRDNYASNQRAHYEYNLGVSFLFRTFGYNRMQFDDGLEPTGITKEWISDTIDPSVGTGNNICIVPQNGKGGVIDMIEIIEATGTLGCTVEVGYILDTNENTGVDPSTLSYTYGRAECPVNIIWRMRSNYDLLYRVVSGAGTGSFRIRVRYRI